MAESMTSCLRASKKLPIVALVGKEKEVVEIFYKRNLEENSVKVSVTPRVLSILQELKEKSREMISEDFDPFRSLVNPCSDIL